MSMKDTVFGKEVQTIDVTPTWSGILSTLLVIYRDAETAEGRKMAVIELQRMAALADKYVEEHKEDTQ